MLIPHKGHTDTIQVYSVTVMTHVKALQAGHSSQGTSEPITPVLYPGAEQRLSDGFYCICSKYGFGISISEGIIVYALNVMLLVEYVSRRVVMVSTWCDRSDMRANIKPADWRRAPEFAAGYKLRGQPR